MTAMAATAIAPAASQRHLDARHSGRSVNSRPRGCNFSAIYYRKTITSVSCPAFTVHGTGVAAAA
jgi:hypothetical protein